MRSCVEAIVHDNNDKGTGPTKQPLSDCVWSMTYCATHWKGSRGDEHTVSYKSCSTRDEERHMLLFGYKTEWH